MNMNTTVLSLLGIKPENEGVCIGGKGWGSSTKKEKISSFNPSNNEPLASVWSANANDYDGVSKAAQEAFKKWRNVPAPVRGELVRQIGEALREKKDLLGTLVSLECGKIKTEGDGEVQEMIDMADFAVGLSRQLYGLTMHSERPNHRMYEQWHPLGICGIISAFNFPVAVWAWNAFLAAVCGNVSIWKPSPKTPLTAIAIQHICNQVMEKLGYEGIFNLVIGSDVEIGESLINDKAIPLVSFTGSTRVGKHVQEVVGRRFGKTILELGGNNAVIVDKNANLEMVLRSVLFGAVGTAGQRCTTTRRLIVHDSVFDTLVNRLKNAYQHISIGNPLENGVLMGPLIDADAVTTFQQCLSMATEAGAEIIAGGEVLSREGNFVKPALVKAHRGMQLVKEERFVPILYVMSFTTLEEAIEINNEVSQGLSSALFTDSLQNAELFLSVAGSDCGIANINLGTSGAEIGGAFGGEKETGGGRESGSDAWKGYMRRQTNTINWGSTLPLAQGVTFDVGQA